MANKRRTFRLAEQIREMIAWQLQKAADPRFHMVTVTSVILSPDMRNAKVYWVVSGGNQNIPDVDEAFESAEGLFKRSLAKELKLRFVPSLKFYYDDTFDVTDSVGKLLSRIKREGEAVEGDLPDESNEESLNDSVNDSLKDSLKEV